MEEELDENNKESVQTRSNSDVETDIILNVNSSWLVLNVVRRNLTKKVDELAVSVTQKWPKEPETGFGL